MARFPGKETKLSKKSLKKARGAGKPIVPQPLARLFLSLKQRINAVLSRRMPNFTSRGTRIISRVTKHLPKVTIPDHYRFRARSYAGRLPGFFSGIIDLIGRLINLLRTSRPALIGLVSGILIAFIIILVVDFMRVKNLADFQPNVTTKIFDKNGILVSELFAQKREIISFKKIPRDLVNAVVAIEDENFYSHWGISPRGIVRAFFINIFSGRVRQGGSTITQQLAKILLTTQERSFYRKIKEAFIALMIEMTYSKDEIMGLYLNQIFLGHGTYGVESAAVLYFNKHVWELNLAECALLATLPSSPNMLSPIRHPKISMQRHRIVLAKMVEQGNISVQTAERAYLAFWPEYLIYINDLAPSLTSTSSRLNRAPWFTEMVRRDLVKKYGSEMVYEKGLRVYTTLDVNKQEAAQEALRKWLKRHSVTAAQLSFKNNDIIVDQYGDLVEFFCDFFDLPPFRKTGSRENEKINNIVRTEISEELECLNLIGGIDGIDKFLERFKRTYGDDRDLQQVEGCIISIDHRNGYIEALVGGSEFSSINQLNRCMQSMRQPGSAVKPLIYSAAIESGQFTAASTILDSPIVYLDNEGGDWEPENYEGDFYGFVPLRKALAMSINVVSVRIADKLGISYVMKYMAKLLKFDAETTRRRIPRNFSIALGTLEVSPFELTRAYAIIANGGRDVIPFSIRRVEDNQGTVLENREEIIQRRLDEEAKNGSIQILKPETAQVMISLMRSVVSGGTGSAANCGHPTAGKTGTTNSWKDAWFLGFTPQLTTGVWVGYDKLGMSLGTGMSGGSVAAPIFGDYMREAMRGEANTEFPVYAGLEKKTVCKKSGLLPGSACRGTNDELFVPGTIPDKTCEVCSGAVSHQDLPSHGPKENITREQKSSIMRNLQKDKGNTPVDNLNEDLLE